MINSNFYKFWTIRILMQRRKSINLQKSSHLLESIRLRPRSEIWIWSSVEKWVSTLKNQNQFGPLALSQGRGLSKICCSRHIIEKQKHCLPVDILQQWRNWNQNTGKKYNVYHQNSKDIYNLCFFPVFQRNSKNFFQNLQKHWKRTICFNYIGKQVIFEKNGPLIKTR